MDVSEFTIEAPEGDEVLEASAGYFARGLYPPFEGADSSQTLRNGSEISSPGGAQIVPVRSSTPPSDGGGKGAGKDKEDTAWLQSASACEGAKTSSNSYYYSDEYGELLGSTGGFYRSLDPVTGGVFPRANLTYKNAYAIFDYVNVASIHNTTGRIDELRDPVQSLGYLEALAGQQQFGLAYNSSDTTRAVEGMSLAGNVLAFFDGAVANATAAADPAVRNKLNVQFGAYSTFLSFFGLVGLSERVPGVFRDRIPDYASVMGFELFVDGGDAARVAEDELKVRFLFHNGTLEGEGAEFRAYNLVHGNADAVMGYGSFKRHLASFAVRNEEESCRVCGCSYASTSAAEGGDGGGTSGDGGLTRAQAGVVGAFVTLGVLVIVGVLVWLGLRRRRAARGAVDGEKGGKGEGAEKK